MSVKDDPITSNDVIENPQVADTNTSKDGDVEQNPDLDVKVGQSSLLSDAEVNLLENLEKLPEQDRVAKLESMDKSGRGKSADKMRSILGITKPQDQENLQKIVESELAKRGITPEILSEFSKKKEEEVRRSVVLESGLNPDEVLRDERFLKAYHSEELSSKDLKDRTELAIKRAFVGKQSISDPDKELKAKNMTAPSSGDKKDRQVDFSKMSAAEQSNWLKSQYTSDLQKQFGA